MTMNGRSKITVQRFFQGFSNTPRRLILSIPLFPNAGRIQDRYDMRHRWPQAVHVRKHVIGSSAERVWTCTKFKFAEAHLRQ